MNVKKKERRFEDGFTLIEMLVSVAIFALVMVAVYFFFDRGQWMYLHSQRRANLQENARLTMEAMEREMRMISFGVPTGTGYGSESTWMPAVIVAEKNRIGFRGDVDNFNSQVTAHVDATDASLAVASDPDDAACNEASPADGAMIIVERGRNWAGYTCSVPDPAVNSIDIDPVAGREYEQAEIEIFSPEHVFYRLTPDTDDDGICDLTTDYSQCKIERAVKYQNAPFNRPIGQVDWPDDDDVEWLTFATNIKRFELEYFVKGAPLQSLGSPPITDVNLGLIDMIEILMTGTDRGDLLASTPGDPSSRFQDVEFMSQILIRKRKF